MQTRRKVLTALIAAGVLLAVVVVAATLAITFVLLNNKDGKSGAEPPSPTDNGPHNQPAFIGSYNDPTGMTAYWDVTSTAVVSVSQVNLLSQVSGQGPLTSGFYFTTAAEFGEGPLASVTIPSTGFAFQSPVANRWIGTANVISMAPLSVSMWAKLSEEWLTALLTSSSPVTVDSTFAGTHVYHVSDGLHYGWRMGWSVATKSISVELYNAGSSSFASGNFYDPALGLDESSMTDWFYENDLQSWRLYSFSWIDGKLSLWKGCSTASPAVNEVAYAGTIVGYPALHSFELGQDQRVNSGSSIISRVNVLKKGALSWIRVFSRKLVESDLQNFCSKSGVLAAHWTFPAAAPSSDRADWWFGRDHPLSVQATVITDPTYGRAISCDANSFANYIGDGALEFVAPPFGVALWFRSTGTPTATAQVIAGAGFYTSADPEINEETPGKVVWEIRYVSSTGKITIGLGPVPPAGGMNAPVPGVYPNNTWHHVALWISDINSQTGWVSVNGAEPTAITPGLILKNRWTAIFTSSGPTYTFVGLSLCRDVISFETSGSSSAFIGNVADVRMYTGNIAMSFLRTLSIATLRLEYLAGAYRSRDVYNQAQPQLAGSDMQFGDGAGGYKTGLYSAWGVAQSCLFMSMADSRFLLSPSANSAATNKALAQTITSYNEFTLTFWMRTAGPTAGFQTIFSTRRTVNPNTPQIEGSLKGYNVYLNPINYAAAGWVADGNAPFNGYLSFWWSQCGGVSNTTVPITHGWRKFHFFDMTSNLNWNKFMHVAITYSNVNKEVQAFINGAKSITASPATNSTIGYWPKICPLNSTDIAPTPLAFGRSNEGAIGNPWPFFGQLANLRLYESVLSTTMIEQSSKECEKI